MYLPLANNPVREMIDINLLVEIKTSPSAASKLPTLRQAKSGAAIRMKDKSIKSIQSLVLRADGSLHLVQFGCRGGKKTLWNFGKI